MKIEMIAAGVAWIMIVVAIVFFERQATELSNVIYEFDGPSLYELRQGEKVTDD
jgi:hypothetical protein